jgi:hypothetical protein
MPGRPINKNKEVAELWGEATYVGSMHGCGQSERYTKTGSCVFCARRRQRENRETLSALKQERDAGQPTYCTVDGPQWCEERSVESRCPHCPVTNAATHRIEAGIMGRRAPAKSLVEIETDALDSESEVKYPEVWD